MTTRAATGSTPARSPAVAPDPGPGPSGRPARTALAGAAVAFLAAIAVMGASLAAIPMPADESALGAAVPLPVTRVEPTDDPSVVVLVADPVPVAAPGGPCAVEVAAWPEASGTADAVFVAAVVRVPDVTVDLAAECGTEQVRVALDLGEPLDGRAVVAGGARLVPAR